jgi:uncharacterized protein YndB with AHSA1/START domain
MTEAFARSAVISAPPETVWRVLTDFPHGDTWLPGTADLRLDGELRSGATLHFTARGKPRSSTVTEVSAGRLLTLTSTQGPVTAAYAYTLAPAGAGTRIDLVVDVAVTGPLRLLAPVIRAAVARQDGGQLERLTGAVAANGKSAY